MHPLGPYHAREPRASSIATRPDTRTIMKPLTRSRARGLALMAASAVIALTPSLGAPSATRASALAMRAGATLNQLPGALTAGPASQAPLTVVLPKPLSGPELRAAIIAVSAAQQGAGDRGLPVRVLVDPSRARLAQVPGSEIVIAPSAGTGALALTPAPHVGVRLQIGGTGDGLLTAARVLSTPAIHAFTSSSASVPAGLAHQVQGDQAPSQVAISPAAAHGDGPLSVTTQFTLPLDRQISGDTTLKIISAYDAAGGGRVSARLQGGALAAGTVPGSGVLRSALTAKLSATPALTGDALPGWWAHPGVNQLTITATPHHTGAAGTLQVLGASRVSLHTTPRPAALQLGLWPFPIYNDHAWTRATVVLPQNPQAHTLSELIGALANTERVTGVPADPNVALGTPSPSEASGNLVLVGSTASAAAAGQMPGVRGVHASQPALAGMLEEVRLPNGTIALLAHGARALSALGPGYALGSVSGRAALVDSYGTAHSLAAGEPIHTFAQPRMPWLAPLAFLALLALGWVLRRTVRAQRRVAALPAYRVGEPGGSA